MSTTPDRLSPAEKLEKLRDAVRKHPWLGALISVDEQGAIALTTEPGAPSTSTPAKAETPKDAAFYDRVREDARKQHKQRGAWRPPAPTT